MKDCRCPSKACSVGRGDVLDVSGAVLLDKWFSCGAGHQSVGSVCTWHGAPRVVIKTSPRHGSACAKLF